MTKYHVFTEVFNPNRGMVEVFLVAVYARDIREARKLGREEIERGEKLIIRAA